MSHHRDFKEILTAHGRRWLGVVSLGMIAVLSVVVFVFRDDIAGYATLGYPTLFVACALLNSGVFGLSPSGAVAVTASFVFSPVPTAIVAGLGAGCGEVTSLVAGRIGSSYARDDLPGWMDRVSGGGRVRLLVTSYVASLLSGNLSDMLGLVVGGTRADGVMFMLGATLAKVTKMLLLVWISHEGVAAIGDTLGPATGG